jgi:acyl CoA:acetate/3-ketoacid CoA transferase alpha subunit/acyl CoA:acetate/3-ketoacid CoA transferase beta subunit
MFGEFEERVRDKLELAARPSPEDKVMDLGEAVRELVRPGMHLHIAQAYLRPSAAIYEICRQSWGTDPAFTISALGLIANMVLFVHGNLARKLITTFCGDHYPFPSPNRIYQEAWRDGRVEIENWSVLTLPQRLLAGATGVEWMPTHSILGSSMAGENAGDFWVSSDPDGNQVGMVRALRPDLTVLHAWAADPAGNVLLAPPHAEGVASAFAAKEGVLVTAEKVVDTEFLKRYSHFVKIPGYLVRAVCPAPMGVHPSGASNQGIKELDAYAEDEEFLLELRAACKDEGAMRAWVDEWLLGCPDHDAYIRKLGFERLWFLKGRSATDAWWSELATRAPGIDTSDSANPTEMMITAASRLIRRKVEAEGYRTVLAGIGASNLAAWKACYDLRRDDLPVDLMAEVGFFGYTPMPGDPFIFSFRNIPTCTMLTDVFTVLGSMVGAESNRCIGALGAGQVDVRGNINSTCIPELKLWLVGSGGACDVACGAREMVVTIALNKLRCVDKVSYVTAPGERITSVVTDLGVFEKLPGEDTLTLTAYYANSGFKDAGEAVEAIADKCGWELAVAEDLQVIDPPTPDELRDIRLFDPRRYFLDG